MEFNIKMLKINVFLTTEEFSLTEKFFHKINYSVSQKSDQLPYFIL